MAENNAAGNGVALSSRAQIALDAISPEEREQVVQAAAALCGLDPAAWPGARVISIAGTTPVYYLLRASPDLRAIIRRTESGQIEISDVVHEETLRLFRERQRPAGVPE